MKTNTITEEQIKNLIKENSKWNIELSINGEYYLSNDFKSLKNAFKTGYNETITLKINGEVKVLNGILI